MKNLLNSVRLVGNVGYDPEIREFESGKKLAKLTLATNEKVTLLSGDVVNNTQWHRLVAWGAVADRFEKMVKKGSKLMVEGCLQHRSYLDSDGQKKETSEVVVKNILLIEAKGKSVHITEDDLQPAEM
jgi:single-strand DNA-binding protein